MAVALCGLNLCVAKQVLHLIQSAACIYKKRDKAVGQIDSLAGSEKWVTFSLELHKFLLPIF